MSGSTSSTIILIICLGVLNCPFFPAVESWLSSRFKIAEKIIEKFRRKTA